MAAKDDATAPADVRLVTRNEPVPVSFQLRGGGIRTYEVTEIGWRERNDLGELVMKTYSEAVNMLLNVSAQEGGADRLDSTLFEAHIDYAGLLALAFPDSSPEDFAILTYPQMTELLTESLKLNGFDRLVHLVNPKEIPLQTGENEPPTSDQPTDDGEKTE